MNRENEGARNCRNAHFLADNWRTIGKVWISTKHAEIRGEEAARDNPSELAYLQPTQATAGRRPWAGGANMRCARVPSATNPDGLIESVAARPVFTSLAGSLGINGVPESRLRLFYGHGETWNTAHF